MTIKKIAVQIAGNLRTFEQCAPYLKKYLLSRYDCDVFLHTFGLDHRSPAYHGGIGGDPSQQMSRAEMDEKITHHYQPKKFVIATDEEKIKTDGLWHFRVRDYMPHLPPTVPLNGAYRMHYGKLQANQLRQDYEKKHKIKYDYVVFIRPDILLLEPLILETYQDFFHFNPRAMVLMALPQERIRALSHETKDVIYPFQTSDDLVSFGKPESMDIFTAVFHHFDRYFKQAPNLPFPRHMASTFECFHLLYARDNGLWPLHGKLNYIVKRLDPKYDGHIIHPDRPLLAASKKLVAKQLLIRESAAKELAAKELAAKESAAKESAASKRIFNKTRRIIITYLLPPFMTLALRKAKHMLTKNKKRGGLMTIKNKKRRTA